MSNRTIMILAGTGIVITMLCCYGVYSFFQPTPADIAALETNTAQYATETAAVLVGPATIVLPATGDTTATPPPAIPPPLITATPWQTATPVTDDPLEFMRHYYDVIVSHGCRRAYGMLSDRYKDTFPVENRYIQYETWCQSFAKIDLIEKETLSNDGHSAAVRIVVQWTQNNGRVINTRPMKVELVRDDSGKVWLIDSSVFTE